MTTKTTNTQSYEIFWGPSAMKDRKRSIFYHLPAAVRFYDDKIKANLHADAFEVNVTIIRTEKKLTR